MAYVLNYHKPSLTKSFHEFWNIRIANIFKLKFEKITVRSLNVKIHTYLRNFKGMIGFRIFWSRAVAILVLIERVLAKLWIVKIWPKIKSTCFRPKFVSWYLRWPLPSKSIFIDFGQIVRLWGILKKCQKKIEISINFKPC